MPSFAEDLRALMKERGESLRSVARRVGVDYAYLSRVLRGQRPFPAKHAESMADALDLKGAAQESFIVDACLESAHPALRAYVSRLRQRADGHRRVADEPTWR